MCIRIRKHGRKRPCFLCFSDDFFCLACYNKFTGRRFFYRRDSCLVFGGFVLLHKYFAPFLSGSLFFAFVASVAGGPVSGSLAAGVLSAGGGEGEPEVSATFVGGSVPEGVSLKLTQCSPDDPAYAEGYKAGQREAGDGCFSVWGLSLEGEDGSAFPYGLPVDITWEASGSMLSHGSAGISVLGVYGDGSFLDCPVTEATEGLLDDGSLYVPEFTFQSDGFAGTYVLLEDYSTGWVSLENTGDHAIALDLSITGGLEAGSRGYRICFDGKPSGRRACDGSRVILKAGQEAVLHGVPDGADVEAVYAGVSGEASKLDGVSRKFHVAGGTSGGVTFTGEELAENKLPAQNKDVLNPGSRGTVSDRDVDASLEDGYTHGDTEGNIGPQGGTDVPGSGVAGEDAPSDAGNVPDGGDDADAGPVGDGGAGSGDKGPAGDGPGLDGGDRKDLGEDTKKSPDTGLTSFAAVFAVLAIISSITGSSVLAYRHGRKSHRDGR